MQLSLCPGVNETTGYIVAGRKQCAQWEATRNNAETMYGQRPATSDLVFLAGAHILKVIEPETVTPAEECYSLQA